MKHFLLCVLMLMIGCQHKLSQQLVSLDTGHRNVVVLVFTSIDCPIANALVPEFNRLQMQVDELDGTLWLVHTYKSRTMDEVHAHAKEFGIQSNSQVDETHALVKEFDITVTPEIVVLAYEDSSSYSVIYQGKINNLFESPGNRRDRATEHYARDAIRAVAQGMKVSPSYRKPIGCLIEVNHD